MTYVSLNFNNKNSNKYFNTLSSFYLIKKSIYTNLIHLQGNQQYFMVLTIEYRSFRIILKTEKKN